MCHKWALSAPINRILTKHIILKLFAAYMSAQFLIHTMIFLETSPPLPADVHIDVTVVTQSSYFHLYTKVQKNLFDVFPRCNLTEDNFLLFLKCQMWKTASDGSTCSFWNASFCPIVNKYMQLNRHVCK